MGKLPVIFREIAVHSFYDMFVLDLIIYLVLFLPRVFFGWGGGWGCEWDYSFDSTGS